MLCLPWPIAKFCRVKGVSCALCSCRHHQSICELNEAKTDTNSSNTEAVVSSVFSTVKLKADMQNTVLLQTVKAWAGGPAGRKVVRCLSDGGSQRSFIHEYIVKELGLPVVRQETLNLHTFGSTTPATVQRNIVQVWMENVWNSHIERELRSKQWKPLKCVVL